MEDSKIKKLITLMNEARKALKKHDSLGLRKLSNKAISIAAVENDAFYASLSVVTYALSKLLSKPHVLRSELWPNFIRGMSKRINQAIVYAKENNIQAFRDVLESLEKDIEKFDKEVGNYLHTLVEKAKVKQASRAYGMGLSPGQAASLTGADRIELLKYIGTTKIHDRIESVAKSVKDRLKAARRLFLGEEG